MSKPQSKRPGAIAIWLVIVVPVALYALNPFGATVDKPSARMLGHALFRVPSSSMATTLPPGSFAIVDVRGRSARHATRNDIVMYRSPSQPDTLYLSRVVATGGDRIEVRGRVVTLNGATLDDPYAHWERDVPLDVAETVIPDGNVFLLGDNRSNSLDSRVYGPLPIESVAGIVRQHW